MSTQASVADEGNDDDQAHVEQSDTNSEYSNDGDESSASELSDRDEIEHDLAQPAQRQLKTKRPRKSKASRTYYSDEYLKLFRNNVLEFENGDDGVPFADLFESQLGAVHWLPSEKERLFNALSRKGRLNVPGLAAWVGKSELEIRDYLLFLREKEAERHLFEKQTKRISHADVPCAIEISKDCENALERAADAIAAFQDEYDRALAERQHPGRWLIDSRMAEAMDEHVLDQEELDSDSDDVPDNMSVPAEGLFRLASWLELSERLFMNAGSPRLDQNWHNVASEGGQPAVTYAAFSDFHDLALSITRRLMQTAIFLAKSRIQSTKGNGYNAKPLVKQQDVLASLEILGMTGSLSDWLVGVARRNNLRVIRGSHDRGSSRSQVLSYDEVEKDISKRKSRRKGRRSVSVASISSVTSDVSIASVEDHEAAVASGGTTIKEKDGPRAWGTLPSAPVQEDAHMGDLDSDMDAGDDDEIHEVEGDDSEADEYGGLSFHPSTSRQKRRQAYLEYQQDAYMEELDRLKGEEEERRLWQTLAHDPSTTIKGEIDDELGIQPKTLRKTREDLGDWQSTFYAEWEAFAEQVPDQSFHATGKRRKRRRSQDESDLQGNNERPRKTRSFPIRSRSAPSEQTAGSGESD